MSICKYFEGVQASLDVDQVLAEAIRVSVEQARSSILEKQRVHKLNLKKGLLKVRPGKPTKAAGENSVSTELQSIHRSLQVLAQYKASAHAMPLDEPKEYSEARKKAIRQQVKRLQEEKEARKRQREAIEEQERQVEMQRLRKEAELTEQLIEEAKLKKQQQIEALKQKRELRQQEKQEILGRLHTRNKSPNEYFYTKAEEQFVAAHEISQREKEQEVFAKQKLRARPLSHIELLEHMKKYSQLQQEAQARRTKNFRATSVNQSIAQIENRGLHNFLQQLKAERSTYEQVKNQRHQLSMRMKQYGQVIKYMHPPKPSEKLKQQLEEVKNRLATPVKYIPRARSSAAMPKLQRRKRPTSIQQLPAQTPKPVVDYLAERRRLKKSARSLPKLQETGDVQSLDHVMNRCKLMDELSKSRERVARGVGKDLPRLLTLEEEATDLVLGSLKTKVNLLK